MLGNCVNNTHTALFITDSWDISAYEAWRGNLLQIKNYAHFETYLKISNKAVPII